MFGSRIILFLFGATIISGHVLRKEKLYRREKAHSIAPEIVINAAPSRYTDDISLPQEISPSLPFRAFQPQFMQQGSNLFYKPQFMLSPMHYTPSSVIIEKDCDDKRVPEPPIPEIQTIVIEEPMRIPEVPIIVPAPMEEIKEIKPIVIPQAPELSPCTKPEFPSAVVFEEVIPPAPLPIIPGPQIIDIPEAPKLPPMPELPTPVFVEVKPIISASPEVIEVPLVPEFKPIEIPKSPELGPFVMPAIPSQIIMETQSLPCIHETNLDTLPDVIPEAPKVPEIMEIIELKPINLPQPPELPPFVMPAIPTILVDESASLPAFPEPEKVEINEYQPIEIPEAPKQPEIEEIIEFKPMDLPQPPELPPFVMPAIPSISIYEPEKVVIPELKPIEIPEAPVLPPFVAPQVFNPITIEVLPPAPQILEVIPCPPENIPPASTQIEFKPMDIPEAPFLKPFVMPPIPETVMVEVSNNVSDEPCLNEDKTVPETKPPIVLEIVPPAPELPPFIMPEIPTIQHIADKEEPLQIQPETFEIPEAPLLPPFVAPSYPTPILWPSAAPQELPCLTETIPSPPIHPIPEEPIQYVEFKPMNIPEAPILKPFVLPSIPEPVLIEMSDSEQSLPHEMEKQPEVFVGSLPSAPVLTPLIIPHVPISQNFDNDKIVSPSQNQFQTAFAMFHAQNIFIERVLPNLIVSEKNCS